MLSSVFKFLKFSKDLSLLVFADITKLILIFSLGFIFTILFIATIGSVTSPVFLENGTKLNLSDLEEATVDVYVPFTDLDLAQFHLVKQFAEQGYDIYDINSDFYNDYCAAASIDGNDITLDDRKKDIYPHNVTLCKSNCRYKGIYKRKWR